MLCSHKKRGFFRSTNFPEIKLPPIHPPPEDLDLVEERIEVAVEGEEVLDEGQARIPVTRLLKIVHGKIKTRLAEETITEREDMTRRWLERVQRRRNFRNLTLVFASFTVFLTVDI